MGLRPSALEGGMDGRTDGWTDGRMDGRTENLPILQDFVPYWGRCPATEQLQPKNCLKWGKGTADHMMPLGDWLCLFQSIFIKASWDLLQLQFKT